MRETTSSCGAASSSGSLNGCTPRQMPLASSNTLWNSALGIVGTNSTPSTSSRASIIAQPDFDIVVGTMIFLRFVCGPRAIGFPLQRRQFFDFGDVAAVPGRAQHHLIHHESLRQQRDI